MWTITAVFVVLSFLSPRPSDACDQTPTGVAAEDSFLHYLIPDGLTPDESLWGKQAKLAFRRVFPLYANGKCDGVPTHVAVLSHGGTITGPAAFDLRDPTGGDDTSFSLQRTLALQGIESYALEHLGYGRSSRFFLNDPCNASKPGDELGGALTSNAHVADQQGSLLIPNPLAERCEHTSNVRFARPAMAVFDLVQIIDYALAASKPTSGRVTVLGYSAGGARVGAFLDPANFERGNDPNANLSKVDRAILLAPVYDRLGSTEEAESPTPAYPTFPLAASTEASIVNPPGFWRMLASREAVCTGHRVPGTPEQLWRQLLERETAGRDWGKGEPDDDKKTGLSRFPTFSRHRFNQVVVGRYVIPFLLIQGLDDQIVSASGSCNLYNDAPGALQKVALYIGCASHMSLVEGCDPSRCTGGWAGPRASVQEAIAEWIKSGTVGKGNFASGRLLVNQNSGDITPILDGAPCPPSP
jgi:alpha-beta hydrolase superfamily lysophospholipase